MYQKEAEKVAYNRLVTFKSGKRKGQIFTVRRVEFDFARLRPWPDGGQLILADLDKLEVLARE